MKINKTTIITESKLVEEDEVKQDIINPDMASETELLKDIEKTEVNTGVELTNSEAEEQAKTAKLYADIVYNPYGTSNPGKLKKALQRSLAVALRQQRNGIYSDFPNILIYGQAGVGKTAIIREFCNEHNITMVPINAGTMAPEMIGGIPYPEFDEVEGGAVQRLVANPMWKELNKPSILFCDEVNRADIRATNNLFGLINNHVLPGAFKDKKTGEVKSEKFYPNLLFTVSAINPPTAAFKRSVNPLDSAFISRNGAVIGQEANMGEFASYFDDFSKKIDADEFIKPKTMAAKLDTLYKKVLDDPNTSVKDKKVFQGQNNLVQALAANGLTFNTQEEIDEIYSLHKDEGITFNYLNPRSLSMFIRRCNGTKRDFLDIIKNESGLRPEDQTKIKNCLATYVDKVTTGNNLFGNNSSTTQRTTASQQASIDALNTFMNSL